MVTQNKKSQFSKIFQNMLKLMYKSKSVALMPDITDDDEPAENRSPFLTPRSKVSSLYHANILSRNVCSPVAQWLSIRLETVGSLLQDLLETLGCVP